MSQKKKEELVIYIIQTIFMSLSDGNLLEKLNNTQLHNFIIS